jgi:lambda repressor-like predicted transcriptional regulator
MHENQTIAGRHKSGWKILEWCAETGISRSSAYNLLTADPPRLESVKFGRSRIVTTPPSEFLRSLKQS